MHMLFVVVAMLFAASTPFLAKAEAPDGDGASDSTPIDSESNDDVLPATDSEAPDARRND